MCIDIQGRRQGKSVHRKNTTRLYYEIILDLICVAFINLNMQCKVYIDSNDVILFKI